MGVSVRDLKISSNAVILLRISSGLTLLLTFLLAPCMVRAQSVPPDDEDAVSDSSESALEPVLPSSTLDTPIGSFATYVVPTDAQKFHDFAWNAIGPIAFLGSSFAAAIDQGSNFPHEWGQGLGAYSTRVASNFGMGLVTATAQYSLAEAFHEDTAYYRCTCTGFLPRFWHAAVSTFVARRGNDGYASFSVALAVSPFVGPMIAANAWIPDRDGSTLGLRMGTYNLLGQFGQNEALEFLYGGPHTLLGRIQHRFFKKPSEDDQRY
jgi:hypothetical protein